MCSNCGCPGISLKTSAAVSESDAQRTETEVTAEQRAEADGDTQGSQVQVIINSLLVHI